MKKFLIKINGNQYEVEVEEVRDLSAAIQPAKEVKTAPAIAQVAAPAPKPSTPKSDESVPAGAATITAPMPGTILKVSVNPGDMVKKGQVLLILEAMKMENEITASKDGKIASVNVEKGQSVNVGSVLVSMS